MHFFYRLALVLGFALRPIEFPGRYHSASVSRIERYFTVFFFVVSSCMFSYPVYLLAKEYKGDTPIKEWTIGVAMLVVLFVAFSNLLYLLFVDLTLDFRLKRRKMLLLLWSTMDISALSSLMCGLVALLTISLLPAGPFVKIVLALFALCWQWLSEATNIKALYGTHVLKAVLLEGVARILSTVMAMAIVFVITGELANWLETIFPR